MAKSIETELTQFLELLTAESREQLDERINALTEHELKLFAKSVVIAIRGKEIE